ncbi:MFS transporter [Streptomyces sp. NPDC058067]|uniref:MFS transporter n=1 Tax=Streptomyces sp. NPDC058067 TaxID=3346324 RepID=UPI0036EF784A
MSSQSTDVARQNEGWSLRLVLSLVSMVGVLELLAVNYQMISTALPQISAHFRTTQGAWLLTAFLLAGAVLSPLLGKLADMYGKRRLLLVAVAGAALGALLSAVAPSYGVLIAGRALQGLLVPCMFLSYSLMRDVYPPRTLAMSVSIVTSGMGLIAIPSPWLTGWLLGSWGFSGVFWFFVICLAVLLVLIVVTTEESSVRAHSRLDFLGALLLGTGLAGVLVGVSFGPTWGWGAGRTLGCVAGGAVLLAVWAGQALAGREPLIDLRFFKRRPVILTALTAGLSTGSTAVFTTLLPMMCMTPAVLGLGYGFGVDAKGFALFQAPVGIGAVVGGLVVGLTVRRIRPGLLMVAGQLLLTAGALLTAVSHDAKAPLITWALVEGLGLGMAYAAVPNLVIDAVPRDLQASMSSMVQVFQGVVPAILPVVAFTVLNSHIATVAHGFVFYTDGGIRVGFLVAAGASLAGLLLALALSPARRTEQRQDDLVAEAVA